MLIWQTRIQQRQNALVLRLFLDLLAIETSLRRCYIHPSSRRPSQSSIDQSILHHLTRPHPTRHCSTRSISQPSSGTSPKARPSTLLAAVTTSIDPSVSASDASPSQSPSPSAPNSSRTMGIVDAEVMRPSRHGLGRKNLKLGRPA